VQSETGYVIERVSLGDVGGFFFHDDGKLDFPIDFFGIARNFQGIIRSYQ
jgi:hypothetical protein